MGAAEVLTEPSSLYEANYVSKGVLSDMDMVITVRNTLASVKHGESNDRYDELVKTLQATKNSEPAVTAQLVTLLKALAGSVAYIDIDIIQHQKIIDLVFGMSLWDLKPDVMDAFVDLLISLAVTTGKYLDRCLTMLVHHFVPPDWVIKRLSQPRVIDQKMEVLSRVHKALLKIFFLFPLAPSFILVRLDKIMPKTHIKGQVVEIFVENLLKLENSPIGQVNSSTILMMVMKRLGDMDLEIDWNGIPQDDSSRGMFSMEIEDTMNEGDVVFESLDKLMVISFDHLESCKLAGRLDEVFENLFEAFVKYILDTSKPKVSQFLMFYACSLDPENCGVKFGSKLMDIFLSSKEPLKRQVSSSLLWSKLTPLFHVLMKTWFVPLWFCFSLFFYNRMTAMAYLASYLARGKFLPVSYVASMLKRLVEECAEYCRICSDDINSAAHQIFYSACQAIIYVLCFRMRSILDVPRFRSELIPLESILMHKLNPLKKCIPWVVAEFLKQAKAGGLFVVSDSFISDKLLESKRLDAFFPFDPCLLKRNL
ncbi:unnamed protein product [Eruca vesicaria subsp. sativa]|uniref:Uncharacterized protein n=1 Tax=Eruca vesicaria subsp. sativa TaxID=29727 RepID=A0ABC8JP56_ERUVS|nr:unnamed protein product [Eruca vesicaria subsp. sativa]